jgi:hypothetical protein
MISCRNRRSKVCLVLVLVFGCLVVLSGIANSKNAIFPARSLQHWQWHPAVQHMQAEIWIRETIEQER